MQRINYLETAKAGLKFFSIFFTPKERVHTILVKLGKNESWELSLHSKQETYSTQWVFYLVVNNRFAYPLSELLSNSPFKNFRGVLEKSEYFKDDESKNPSAEALRLATQLLGSEPIAHFGQYRQELAAYFPQLPQPPAEGDTNMNLIADMLRALFSAGVERRTFNLFDLEGYCSFAARTVISAKSSGLTVGRARYIDDSVAELLASRRFDSLNLNALQELQLSQAQWLGKCPGKLFMDTLPTIDMPVAEALTKQQLRYLSLRGLKQVDDALRNLISSSNTYISLQTADEVVEEEKVTYSKEIVENSLVAQRKEFASLKKMLSTPDKEVIDSGLTLLASFSDPYLFDTLLEPLELERKEDYYKLSTERMFRGAKKDQPFYNYAVTGILFHAGPDALLANRIKQRVNALAIDLFDLSYLHCFHRLELLELSDSLSKLTCLDDLDEGLPLKKLDVSACPALEDIQRISAFPIESFYFEGAKKIKSLAALKGKMDRSSTTKLKLKAFQSLQNLDGIEFYQSLEGIDLCDTKNLTDVSSLGALPQLKLVYSSAAYDLSGELHLHNAGFHPALFGSKNSAINISVGEWNDDGLKGSPSTQVISLSCKGMKNLDWLEGFPNLTMLRIECNELVDVSGLRFVPHLNRLEIVQAAIQQITVIPRLPMLQEIRIVYCNELMHVDELELLPVLRNATLSNCSKLQSIEGLTKNPSIRNRVEYLELQKIPALKKLGSLSHFTVLKSITLSGSFNQELLNDLNTVGNQVKIYIQQKNVTINNGVRVEHPIEFRNVTSFDLAGSGLEHIIIDSYYSTPLQGLCGMPRLRGLTISDSRKIQSLNGLKELPALEEVSLNENPELSDIGVLATLPSIRSLRLVKLDKLANVSAIAGLELLEMMEVTDCPLLEVIPRPLGKINFEPVVKYRLKIAEHYKLDTGAVEKKVDALKNNPVRKEAKKQATRIKKLLKERDLATIDSAITLLEGLGDSELLNELLFGIVYEGGGFRPNRLFSGTAPAQPFLNYALTGVLNAASKLPEWREFVDAVTELDYTVPDYKYFSCFRKLEKLKLRDLAAPPANLVFADLKELYLSFSSTVDINLEKLSGCAALEKLEMHRSYNSRINVVNGFSGLRSLTRLRYLSIQSLNDCDAKDFLDFSMLTELEFLSILSEYNHTAKKIPSLQGLEYCTKLHTIRLNVMQIEDTRALGPLQQLRELDLEKNAMTELHLPENAPLLTKIYVGNCRNLSRLSGGKPAEEIDNLDISQTAFESFPVLPGVKWLKEFDASGCEQLRDLKGLSALQYLGNKSNNDIIKFKSCSSLADINDLFAVGKGAMELWVSRLPVNIAPNKVTYLVLPKLEDLSGIEQFPELEYLSLYSENSGSASVSSLRPLSALKKLRRITLRNCNNITSLDGLQHLEHLSYLDLTRMGELRDIGALNSLKVDELYIASGLLKKVDYPGHLQDNIDWMSIP